MNNYFPPVLIKGVVLGLAIGLLTISASSAKAQGGRPGTMSDRERNLQDREMQITLMEKSKKAFPKREPKLLLQEINEDFSRLQTVNNELNLKNSANVVLDFRYVSEAASEIKKRSSRLRNNLVFPESAKADKKDNAPPGEGLKSQLAKLDRLIKSFVTNPVFTDAGVMNAELAAKARGDLDKIVNLSDKVKKHAADLSKNAKSH